MILKAKDYAEKYNNAEDKAAAIKDILFMFIAESEEMIKIRHAYQDSALSGVLRELNQKWNAFAVKTPDVLIDGFKNFIGKRMPDVYARIEW